MTRVGGRRGLALVDGVLALGFVALVLSLVYPVVRNRAFRMEMDRITSDVDALREAAERFREETGHWPPDAEPGVLPDSLASRAGNLSLRGDGYVVDWNRWPVVQVPPAPPPSPEDSSQVSIPPQGIPPRGGRLATPPPQADTIGTRPLYVAALGSITVHSSRKDVVASLLERHGTALSFVRDSTWTLVLGPPSTD